MLKSTEVINLPVLKMGTACDGNATNDPNQFFATGAANRGQEALVGSE